MLSELWSKNAVRTAVVLMAVVMAGYLAARAVEFLITFVAEVVLAWAGGLEVTVNGKDIYLDYVIDGILGLAIAATIVFFVLRSKLGLSGATETGPRDTRKCPSCLSDVPAAARRCAFCTSNLEPEATA